MSIIKHYAEGRLKGNRISTYSFIVDLDSFMRLFTHIILNRTYYFITHMDTRNVPK